MLVKKILTIASAAALLAGGTTVSAAAPVSAPVPAEESVEGNLLFGQGAAVTLAIIIGVAVLLVALAKGDNDDEDPVSP